MSNSDKVVIIKNTFERVFNNGDGKVILDIMCNECELGSVGKYESDRYLACYNDGKRYFLMKILSILDINVKDFLSEYRRSEWNPANKMHQ